jgi:hypothetical protein
MNVKPDNGWFYYSMNRRSPAWTGVPFLYNFLVRNKGAGPYGHVIPAEEVQQGDLVQLKFAGKTDFGHTLLVVSVGQPADPSNILVAAHTNDADNRPLNTYSYIETRGIHIDGTRR